MCLKGSAYVELESNELEQLTSQDLQNGTQDVFVGRHGDYDGRVLRKTTAGRSPSALRAALL